MSLSDLTRRETLRTFKQLSIRLSTSSLALVPAGKERKKRSAGSGSESKKRSAGARPTHTRAKSAPNLSSTPLGPATSNGVSSFSFLH